MPKDADLDTVRVWKRVLGDDRTSTAARVLLADLALVSIDEESAVLRVLEARVAGPARARADEIAAALSRAAGRRIRVTLDTPGSILEDAARVAEGEASDSDLPPDPNHPLVRVAKEIFGAEVADSFRKPPPGA